MIDYDGRRFSPVADGGPEEERVATYHQDGDLLWGEFSGGRARRGSLTGICGPDGSLRFAYCMVLEDGEIVSGRCVSTPQVLQDGRIRLREVWERYGPHADSGVSYLQELPAPRPAAGRAP
ncbi:hypothetical protein [Streptomyces cinereospinus]|uniref:Nuclear transport factor 2 family protein n=1 Tax=Streptomyces cinereospinus TaxID=285561 RepID=A0ABV5MYK2_9ACTN